MRMSLGLALLTLLFSGSGCDKKEPTPQGSGYQTFRVNTDFAINDPQHDWVHMVSSQTGTPVAFIFGVSCEAEGLELRGVMKGTPFRVWTKEGFSIEVPRTSTKLVRVVGPRGIIDCDVSQKAGEVKDQVMNMEKNHETVRDLILRLTGKKSVDELWGQK